MLETMPGARDTTIKTEQFLDLKKITSYWGGGGGLMYTDMMSHTGLSTTALGAKGLKKIK